MPKPPPKTMVKTASGWRWKPAKRADQCRTAYCTNFREGASDRCKKHRKQAALKADAKARARKRRVRPASDAELARVQKRLEQLHGPAEGSETPPSA